MAPLDTRDMERHPVPETSVYSELKQDEVTPLKSTGMNPSLSIMELEAEEEGRQFDIPEDAYGAAILAIVRDLASGIRGEDRALNFMMAGFAITVNSLNLLLQFGIVGFISVFVIQPKIREVQFRYREFHENVFAQDGAFDAGLWETYEGKKELCQIAMTNRPFYYCTLFLWIVVMMKEFRTSEKLFRNVWSVKVCSSTSEMIKPQEDGKVYVVAMTKSVRTALYFMVCIPKFCICVALLWLGCKWLSATTRFEDLVMNAVAMEFVTNIDNVLYDVMIPADYKREVEAINFLLPDTGGGYDRRQALKDGWKQCGIYFCSSAIFMVLFANLFQDVLPSTLTDVKDRCKTFIAEEMIPFCSETMLKSYYHALAGIDSPVCYPFGDQSE